jgi:hypothetical protein
MTLPDACGFADYRLDNAARAAPQTVLNRARRYGIKMWLEVAGIDHGRTNDAVPQRRLVMDESPRMGRIWRRARLWRPVDILPVEIALSADRT